MVDQRSSESEHLPLTPRQDRIEAAIARVLRANGTRSELRELVYQFADLARVQGTPSEHAISAIKSLAQRSLPSFPGDAAADRMAMIVRWCTTRYYRAD